MQSVPRKTGLILVLKVSVTSTEVQGEQDNFRTFKWLYEIDNLDDVLEESRYLLKI